MPLHSYLLAGNAGFKRWNESQLLALQAEKVRSRTLAVVIFPAAPFPTRASDTCFSITHTQLKI